MYYERKRERCNTRESWIEGDREGERERESSGPGGGGLLKGRLKYKTRHKITVTWREIKRITSGCPGENPNL